MVCVFVTRVSRAKTSELIEELYRGRQTAQETMYYMDATLRIRLNGPRWAAIRSVNSNLTLARIRRQCNLLSLRGI